MMKRNIQFIICLLAFTCLNVLQVKAQSRSFEGSITVNPVRLEQVGDSLYIDMDIVLNEVKVKSTRGVDLIPQLVSSEKSCNLPEVTMKGRDEYRVYERSLSLMNAAEKCPVMKNLILLSECIGRQAKRFNIVIFFLMNHGWLTPIWIFNEMNAVVVRHY